MHRRRTERPRTHRKGKLEFEIMSSESSSLPIVTQELLLCGITSFQSDDRHRRGSVHTHLLCCLVTPTGTRAEGLSSRSFRINPSSGCTGSTSECPACFRALKINVGVFCARCSKAASAAEVRPCSGSDGY